MHGSFRYIPSLGADEIAVDVGWLHKCGGPFFLSFFELHCCARLEHSRCADDIVPREDLFLDVEFIGDVVEHGVVTDPDWMISSSRAQRRALALARVNVALASCADRTEPKKISTLMLSTILTLHLNSTEDFSEGACRANL